MSVINVQLDEGQQDLFDELVFRLRASSRNLDSSDPSLHFSQTREDIRAAARIASYLNDSFDLQRKLTA